MRQFLTTSLTADQVVAWLLTYLVHSTLLLGAAWIVSRRLGGRRLRLQETIWRFALMGALVTATAQLALGGLGQAPLAGRWAIALAAGSDGAPLSTPRSRPASEAPGPDPRGRLAAARPGAAESSPGWTAAALVGGREEQARAAGRAGTAAKTGAVREASADAGGVTAQEKATAGTVHIAGTAGSAGNERVGQTASDTWFPLVDGVAGRAGTARSAARVSGIAEVAPVAGARMASRTYNAVFAARTALGARTSQRGETLASWVRWRGCWCRRGSSARWY